MQGNSQHVGSSWGQVSCSRTPQHLARRSRGANPLSLQSCCRPRVEGPVCTIYRFMYECMYEWSALLAEALVLRGLWGATWKGLEWRTPCLSKHVTANAKPPVWLFVSSPLIDHWQQTVKRAKKNAIWLIYCGWQLPWKPQLGKGNVNIVPTEI